jgi:hypothetical protein
MDSPKWKELVQLDRYLIYQILLVIKPKAALFKTN